MAILEGGNLCNGAPFADPPYLPSRDDGSYNSLHTFDLPRGADKTYKQQFADMYFLRLAQLKEAVRQRAEEAWGDFSIGNAKATPVDRVLDVRQGALCWIIGTVYMEMGLKPNILDDIHKEHYIAAPARRFTYISPSGNDEMMLEDESGRLRITGKVLEDSYVTGCVLAALGTEQSDGTFQVIATQYADLPPQPERWERSDATVPASKRGKAGKLAIISGLGFTGKRRDPYALDMLIEYLTGESGASPDQTERAGIKRLIIAGNSFWQASPIPDREEHEILMATRPHYGYDSGAYDTMPVDRFDSFLDQIIPHIPITLIPGPSDPANVALPQQPLHPALFPISRELSGAPSDVYLDYPDGLDAVTNPFEADIEGWRVLATGGQNVDDVLKYTKGIRAIEVMDMMLRWRCIAPTAPDTLWCYPFQEDDPFILKDCPHLYIVGSQKKFQKRTIVGPAGQQVIVLAIPKFRLSKTLVLVDLETLEVETVKFKARRRKKDAETGGQEEASAKQEEVSTKQEEASAKQEEASAKQEDAPTKQEEVSTKRKVRFSEPEETPTEQEEVSTKQEEVSTKRKVRFVEREETPTEQEEVSTKQEEVSTKRKVRFVEREETPPEQEEV